MTIKLKPEGADDRNDMVKLALSLLSYKGEEITTVAKVTFKHNGKKYKFKKDDTIESINIKYPNLNML